MLNTDSLQPWLKVLAKVIFSSPTLHATVSPFIYWGIDVESHPIQTHQTYRWAETHMVSNHYQVSFVFCWGWPSMSRWSMLKTFPTCYQFGTCTIQAEITTSFSSGSGMLSITTRIDWEDSRAPICMYISPLSITSFTGYCRTGR